MATMVYAASAAFGALDVFALNLSESYFEQPSAAAIALSRQPSRRDDGLSVHAALLFPLPYTRVCAAALLA